FFFRCGMRLSPDLLTVLQTWTTGTAPVRHVLSRSAAAAAMLAGCGSKSPARRKSFCRSTSSRTGFILADPGAPDFVCHQLRELPRARDFTAEFAQVRGSPASPPKHSHRSFVAASLPEKKSGRPDWPYLFPPDHERLHGWSGKPRHRPQCSWPQK